MSMKVEWEQKLEDKSMTLWRELINEAPLKFLETLEYIIIMIYKVIKMPQIN